MNFEGIVSFLLIDLCSYFLPSWRFLSRYAPLPSILIIIAIFVFPESPRWLLATGNKQLALMKVAQFNDKDIVTEIRLKSINVEMNRTLPTSTSYGTEIYFD